MGWAIKRADGTYRSWFANAQDGTLLAGETWVSVASKPTITVPPPPKTQKELDCDAAKVAIDAALADWNATTGKAALAALKKVI